MREPPAGIAARRSCVMALQTPSSSPASASRAPRATRPQAFLFLTAVPCSRTLPLSFLLLLLSASSSRAACPGIESCMHFSADVIISLDDWPQAEEASSIAGCQDTCKEKYKRYYKFRPETSTSPAQCICYDNCVNVVKGVATVGSIESCNPGWVWKAQREPDPPPPPPAPPRRAGGGKGTPRYGPCTIRFAKCPPRCPGRSICLRDGTGAACCCVGLTPTPVIHGGKLRDCRAQ